MRCGPAAARWRAPRRVSAACPRQPRPSQRHAGAREADGAVAGAQLVDGNATRRHGRERPLAPEATPTRGSLCAGRHRGRWPVTAVCEAGLRPRLRCGVMRLRRRTGCCGVSRGRGCAQRGCRALRHRAERRDAARAHHEERRPPKSHGLFCAAGRWAGAGAGAESANRRNPNHNCLHKSDATD